MNRIELRNYLNFSKTLDQKFCRSSSGVNGDVQGSRHYGPYLTVLLLACHECVELIKFNNPKISMDALSRIQELFVVVDTY